jgi:type II secretory pathway pseudopilin PulG
MKYVLTAIILTLAALTVPNFRTAHNRSAQKQTMADMRTVATAWEGRATDRNSYLVGSEGKVPYERLQRALEPTYVKHLPRTDGWGNPFELTSSVQEYSIRAMGSDNRMDDVTIAGPTTDFATDILYTNGIFVAYPEGI